MTEVGEEGTNQPPVAFIEDGLKRVPVYFSYPVPEDRELKAERDIRAAAVSRKERITIEVPVEKDLYCDFLNLLDEFDISIENGVDAALLNFLRSQGRRH